MPRKAGLIKTYGRHKFRTVKAAPWVSPEDVFRSPVSKKEKSFETPTTIRKSALTTCTNLPKSNWNIPKQKTSSIYEKENFPPVTEEKKEWKVNSSTKNSHSMPMDLKTFSTGLSPSTISLYSPALSVTKESCISVQQKVQLGNNSSSVVPETPEWAMDSQSIQTSPHGESSIIDSYKQSYSEIPHNSSIKSNNDKDNISKNDISWLSLSSGSDISIEPYSPLKASQGITRLSHDIACSTSTPIIRANSQNSQLVTQRCQNKTKTSSTRQQNISVSNCQVFVEPIKLTPEQYQAARLSVSNNSSLRSNSLTIYSVRGSLESDLSSHHLKSLDGSNISIEKGIEQAPRISSSSGSTDGIIRDCVVALERLRLSPLIGQEQRKRSSTSSISGASRYSSSSTDNVCMPSTPPRKQAAHMSFVEALTPMKVNPAASKQTAFQKLLLECEQDVPMTFSQYLSPSSLRKCAKIGEGVYGEVFKTINKYKQAVALKIIPINGDFEVNGEPQKSSEEILPEIIISKELSALKYSEELKENSTPNFIDVNRVSLVQDKYPGHLVRQWTKWDRDHQSENDKPDIFSSKQCFLVFEFANGGQDLEHFEFQSYSEALSVLQQVTLSLAVAESSLEFEHRDLHWGNVLIIRTDQEEIDYCLNGQEMRIDSKGVHVSIIDFTLSRLRKDGVTVFCDLSEDESLFTGKGDYQFEIYREMRRINEDDWEMFSPASNVQWLHYIADKLLKNKKYSSRDRQVQGRLRMFSKQVKTCQSAQDVYSEFFQ